MIRQVQTFTTSSPEYIDLSSEIVSRNPTYDGWKVEVPRNKNLIFSMDTVTGLSPVVKVLMAVKIRGASSPCVVAEMNDIDVRRRGSVVGWSMVRGGALTTLSDRPSFNSFIAGVEFVYFVTSDARQALFDASSTLTMVAF